VSETVTRLLVIDSDNVRRGMLACTLPPDRYEITFAKTPETGLDVLTETRAQVVLIGYDPSTADLCQRIHALPNGEKCVLGLIDERFCNELTATTLAESAGADFALPFPFDLTLLEGHLDKLLEEPSRSGAGDPSITPVSEPVPQYSATDGAAPRDQADPEALWESFRSRVEQLHEELDQLDYYRLLDVPPNASGAWIKEAYFQRSIEFHPDRFVQLDDRALAQKIYELFKRITEAFEALMNPETRTKYDYQRGRPNAAARLARVEPARSRSGMQPALPRLDAETDAGRKYVRFAETARRDGKLKSARTYLRLALQYEPQNPRLRARLDQLTNDLNAKDAAS